MNFYLVERDDDFYAYPINMEDINRMPDNEKIKEEMKDKDGNKNARISSATNLEEYWLQCWEDIVLKIVKNYTKKMYCVISTVRYIQVVTQGVQIKEEAAGIPISELL